MIKPPVYWTHLLPVKSPVEVHMAKKTIRTTVSTHANPAMLDRKFTLIICKIQ